MDEYQVIWSPQALEDLRMIFEFIDQQSPQGADEVFDNTARTWRFSYPHASKVPLGAGAK